MISGSSYRRNSTQYPPVCPDAFFLAKRGLVRRTRAHRRYLPFPRIRKIPDHPIPGRFLCQRFVL